MSRESGRGGIGAEGWQEVGRTKRPLGHVNNFHFYLTSNKERFQGFSSYMMSQVQMEDQLLCRNGLERDKRRRGHLQGEDAVVGATDARALAGGGGCGGGEKGLEGELY